MSQTPFRDEPRAFVEGQAAAAWFYSLRGGGSVLDEHLLAIRAVFGEDVPHRFRAAVSPRTRRPFQLFIEIEQPADSEQALERLIRVQRLLLDNEAELAERSRRRRPLANVAVALALPPTNWDRIVEVAERAE